MFHRDVMVMCAFVNARGGIIFFHTRLYVFNRRLMVICALPDALGGIIFFHTRRLRYYSEVWAHATIMGDPILGCYVLNRPDDFNGGGYSYVRLYRNNFGLLDFAVPEIASADLALLAIFGMFHRDGLTGYALGV
jgi:hypothetical protein